MVWYLKGIDKNGMPFSTSHGGDKEDVQNSIDNIINDCIELSVKSITTCGKVIVTNNVIK